VIEPLPTSLRLCHQPMQIGPGLGARPTRKRKARLLALLVALGPRPRATILPNLDRDADLARHAPHSITRSRARQPRASAGRFWPLGPLGIVRRAV
jgi:hypothetical protein